MSASRHQRTVSVTPGVLLVTAVLWAAVVASALGVVASTHDVRKKVDRLEMLRREAAQLQVEWGQYLLEQSTWAAYSRVEAIATQRLNMIPATTEQIVMVRGND
jgi:cell division protein FtsL